MSRATKSPSLVVIAVGRLRAPHLAAAQLYEERVGRYTAFGAVEVAAEQLQAGESVARRREGERLRARIPERAHRVALVTDGKPPRSDEEFSERVGRLIDEPRPLCFLIGGPAGLERELIAECEATLSLGPLTMPHQLARVVLAEALYRALAARAGHPYAH